MSDYHDAATRDDREEFIHTLQQEAGELVEKKFAFAEVCRDFYASGISEICDVYQLLGRERIEGFADYLHPRLNRLGISAEDMEDIKKTYEIAFSCGSLPVELRRFLSKEQAAEVLCLFFPNEKVDAVFEQTSL